MPDYGANENNFNDLLSQGVEKNGNLISSSIPEHHVSQQWCLMNLGAHPTHN